MCCGANYATAKQYALFYILRDSEGKIHKLLQVRKKSGSGVAAMLEESVIYHYDPYGKLLQVEQPKGDVVGNYNPLIYKDYVYDFDTELYYLQSRYYDAEVGRFLNADAFASTGQGVLGTNMFAYCGNNPITMKDATGTIAARGGGDGWDNYVPTSIYANKKDSSQIGLTANSFTETTEEKAYMFLITYEEGVGYSKSFDNGKPINLYFSQEWLGDYSVGWDLNYNGKGVNFEVGTDASFGIHMNNRNVDFGTNQFGRCYIQHTYLTDTGVYCFQKLSFNGPEIVGTVFTAIYAPYLLPVIATTVGASA